MTELSISNSLSTPRTEYNDKSCAGYYGEEIDTFLKMIRRMHHSRSPTRNFFWSSRKSCAGFPLVRIIWIEQVLWDGHQLFHQRCPASAYPELVRRKGHRMSLFEQVNPLSSWIGNHCIEADSKSVVLGFLNIALWISSGALWFVRSKLLGWQSDLSRKSWSPAESLIGPEVDPIHHV